MIGIDNASSRQETFGAVLAGLLCVVLWFGLLGHRDLFDPDEGRYAEIPAAMLHSGDWLTPRLNGFKYFEKPVLQYWGTAAIYQLLGESNATARLFTALMGFASALFVMFLSYRLYGRRAAYYTFLLTVSSMMVVIFGHVLTLDMSLAAFIIVGIGSLVIAQLDRGDGRRTRNWMLLAWAALALGTLTKGLVALVLPFISVLVYSTWQRDSGIWKKLHLFKGLILYLLIASPWFIMVSYENPEFAKFFFIHEHFDRYTNQGHDRAGTIYYFVPFLVLGVSPWLITSVQSLVRPGFSWITSNPGVFNPERFLWTFVVVTFCFFSLGQSKLPGYILPIIPVIAVISGSQMARRQFVGIDRWLLAGLGLVFVATALNLETLASRFDLSSDSLSFRPWLLASGLLYLLASMVLFATRVKPLLAFAAAAILSLAAIQLINQGLNFLSVSRSGRLLSEAITASVPFDAPVFSYWTFSRSAAFYLGRPVRTVGHVGELQMGIDLEPEKYIENFDEFLKIWQTLETAALIANADVIDAAQLGQVGGKIVYEDPGRMVIIKDSSTH